MKKFLALACTLVLMVSCISFAVAEEPVEITYWRGELARDACATYAETLWFQEIQNRLGFTVRIVGPAQGADSNTAVNAMLTSGEYPELLFFNWASQYNGGFEAGIEDGVIYDWSQDPESKEKLSNWWKVIEENDAVRKAVTMDNGSIVQFCHWEPNIARNAYWGYAIRTDWLDRLGLAVPETLEDFEKVLYAFKEQDANGNGDPNDEIPLMGCNWSSNGNSYFLVNSLAAIWGMKVNQIYRDPKNDKMTYWTEYEDGEPFKAYVTTLAKWVADGILDPEFVSQNNDARVAKITSDKAGCFFCFPDDIASLEASLKLTLEEGGYADPEGAHIIGMVPVKGPDGIPYSYDWDSGFVNFAGYTQPTVITTAAVENGTLDYCYQFLNFLYSKEGSDIQNWGVEGVSYTIAEDGTYQWTDLITNDPDYPPSSAVFKYALPTLGAWPKAMSYEAWGAMNLTVEDQIKSHKNYAVGTADLDKPPFTLNPAETEAAQLVSTDINTAVSETYVKVILGQQPAEALDALLAQVEGMGVQSWIDAYQSAYERYQAK